MPANVEGHSSEQKGGPAGRPDIFSATMINGVRFKNRLLRSSVGGRMANYDGTVTDVWKNFEKRFAEGGVSGIISTTFHVNRDRVSPLQYPSIAGPEYVPYLKKYVADITKDYDCRYILQIGDPGYATYTSLFAEEVDSKSSSAGFDLGFGYNNSRTAMTVPEIEKAISDYVDAAARVRESGADGLEITATKGYLIHQFLNPVINRRRDDWGGSPDNRFRFLERIVTGVRKQIGPDYLFGIRLSAADYNYTPLALALFRWPWPFASREGRLGNEEDTMLDYARRLRTLGVDYLHVVTGYGFPNPRDTPGRFPLDEVRIFFNSTRHLSFKASMRATLLNTIPRPVARRILNIGWKYRPGINLEAAQRFKNLLAADNAGDAGLKVIVNGGFQKRDSIEEALKDCDFVSMARALIANPDLPKIYKSGGEIADNKKCSYCNRCVGRTATSPLGCYDVGRFDNSTRAMMRQIMEWNRPDPA